jgi:hypothetical protein
MLRFVSKLAACAALLAAASPALSQENASFTAFEGDAAGFEETAGGAGCAFQEGVPLSIEVLAPLLQELPDAEFQVGGLSCVVTDGGGGELDASLFTAPTVLLTAFCTAADPATCEAKTSASITEQVTCSAGEADNACKSRARTACFHKLEVDPNVACPDGGECKYGKAGLPGICALNNSYAFQSAMTLAGGVATSTCHYKCSYKCHKKGKA